jgi:hypothetical protein
MLGVFGTSKEGSTLSAINSPTQYATLEKIVLAEVQGKNMAIHAYDGMVWKVRSGFLTLFFGGWSILLKAIVDAPAPDWGTDGALAVALLLFSFGFALVAWVLDRNYIRRKFRVILALDELTAALINSGGDVRQIPAGLIAVAGDNSDMLFDCGGYRQARRAELAVYLVPLLALISGLGMIFYR